MSHDDRIIITGSDTGAEFLAVAGLKVLFRGNEDVGRGIQPQKLGRPLLGQMVRHGKERLVTKPKTLAFHSCRHHFKG